MSILDKTLKAGAQIRRRIDGWANAFSGMGTSRDKSTATQVVPAPRLTDVELEIVFTDDALAARMVSALPEESLRQGVVLKYKGENADAHVKQMQKRIRDLNVIPSFIEGATWGQLFGWGGTFIGANDGQEDMAIPFNPRGVSEVLHFVSLDARDVTPGEKYQDPLDPRYGRPEFWRLVADGVRTGDLIHQSRFIEWPGAMTARRTRKAQQGKDSSVLQRAYGPLRSAANVWGATESLMQESSVGVFKIKDLISIIAEDGLSTLRARMEAADMGKSTIRSLLIDQDESYERVQSGVEGIANVVDRAWQFCSAAARMPMTVLFGRSPAGMNATGESDIRQWYDQLKTYQSNVMHPRLEYVVQLIAYAEHLGDPALWEVEFPSLWQMSPTETADLQSKVAGTDKTYIDAAVVMPEEVAISRFGEGGFENPLSVDIALRKRLLAIESGEVEARTALPDPAQNGVGRAPPAAPAADPGASYQDPGVV